MKKKGIIALALTAALALGALTGCGNTTAQALSMKISGIQSKNNWQKRALIWNMFSFLITPCQTKL